MVSPSTGARLSEEPCRIIPLQALSPQLESRHQPDPLEHNKGKDTQMTSHTTQRKALLEILEAAACSGKSSAVVSWSSELSASASM